MIRALGFVVCLPLALCLGVYGCTAAHLVTIGNSLPTPAVRPVQAARWQPPPMTQVAPGLWCCDLSKGGSGIVDDRGDTYRRVPHGWIREH